MSNQHMGTWTRIQYPNRICKIKSKISSVNNKAILYLIQESIHSSINKMWLITQWCSLTIKNWIDKIAARTLYNNQISRMELMCKSKV